MGIQTIEGTDFSGLSSPSPEPATATKGRRKPHPCAGRALRRREGGHSRGSAASSVPPGALQESKAATKGGEGTAGCSGQHSPRVPGSRWAHGPYRKPGPLRPAGLCDSPGRRRNGTLPVRRKDGGQSPHHPQRPRAAEPPRSTPARVPGAAHTTRGERPPHPRAGLATRPTRSPGAARATHLRPALPSGPPVL